MMNNKVISTIIAAIILLSACSPSSNANIETSTTNDQNDTASNSENNLTPFPTRKAFKPGELVDYTAQTGDTLPALALRFNTSVGEILSANPQIPREATTMPPGMPMQIPIYYRALWSSPFQILPDHAFVNGPSSSGFNTAAFVRTQPGWLKDFRVYSGGKWRSGAEMVDYISENYSINPRLLLAILEYQGKALTEAEQPVAKNILGITRRFWESPYLQLVLAANILNNGYYGWRSGALTEFEDVNGILIRPDPWQNAGSVGLQYYFAQVYSGNNYSLATGSNGLAKTYISLFGNPWDDSSVLIPGSLQQPELTLPFPYEQVWSYTGGPHTGWGTGAPLAAIDLAPPSEKSGCVTAKPQNYVTAMADGFVVRSGEDGLALDLDKDGNEKTGWVIFYLHLAKEQRAAVGSELSTGEKIGYPSCAGGHSTGTHVHIARKYNGEWILADSAVPFNMNGWVVRNGSREYLGTLQKGNSVVTACDCGDFDTSISSASP